MTCYFPRSFTHGAHLLSKLKTLRPGYAMDVTDHDLSQVQVPASPLDRQTPDYLIEWFRSRLPFYCEVHGTVLADKWTFHRPAKGV